MKRSTIPLLPAAGVMTACAMLACATASAQTKTTETVTTRDSTGKETTTQVTKVSTSEDITPRSNLITINPLKFFLLYNISYYHRINDVIVIGGGVQTPAISELQGWGIQAEARFHPSRKALRGFYVAPNISYNRLWVSSDDPGEDPTATAFSVGVLVGWQWFPGDEFAIGLGLGYDRWFLSTNNDDETDRFDSFSGGAPALRFDIGYAF